MNWTCICRPAKKGGNVPQVASKDTIASISSAEVYLNIAIMIRHIQTKFHPNFIFTAFNCNLYHYRLSWNFR